MAASPCWQGEEEGRSLAWPPFRLPPDLTDESPMSVHLRGDSISVDIALDLHTGIGPGRCQLRAEALLHPFWRSFAGWDPIFFRPPVSPLHRIVLVYPMGADRRSSHFSRAAGRVKRMRRDSAQHRSEPDATAVAFDPPQPTGRTMPVYVHVSTISGRWKVMDIRWI